MSQVSNVQIYKHYQTRKQTATVPRPISHSVGSRAVEHRGQWVVAADTDLVQHGQRAPQLTPRHRLLDVEPTRNPRGLSPCTSTGVEASQ